MRRRFNLRTIVERGELGSLIASERPALAGAAVYACAALFALAAVVAVAVRVNRVASYAGRMRPEAGAATVSSPGRGRILALLVGQGESVVQGQPVVRLEVLPGGADTTASGSGEYDVRAPCAGRVVERPERRAGDLVEPGAALLDLVPAEAPLFFEAFVPAGEVGGVQPGTRGEVVLDAYLPDEYRSLRAAVHAVSAEAEVQEGQKRFRVLATVEVAPPEIRRLAGLRGHLLLPRGTRTIAESLLASGSDAAR